MDNLLRQPMEWPESDGAPKRVPGFATLDGLPKIEQEPLRICSVCHNLVPFAYFRIRGQIACESCAQRARIGRPAESDAAFMSAFFFGFCGAIFSLILCAGFSSVTHVDSLYFVWFIGWMVGKAMKQGANGLGGSRFQVVAVMLTYVGISLAAVLTELIAAFRSVEALPAVGLGAVVQSALLSPVSHLGGDPIITLIRLTVLVVGLCIAWQMTAAESIRVDGPYGSPSE